MEDMIFSPSERKTRRQFMKKTMLGVSSVSIGGFMTQGCAQYTPAGMLGLGHNTALEKEERPLKKKEKSILSFVTGKDTRAAAQDSLKPLEQTVARAIKDKQVVIKPNAGVMGPEHHHEVADVEQLRGILDFLTPIYDRQIIIAEGVATQGIGMSFMFEEYGYNALKREYNVKLIDANDLSTTTKWILAGYHRPQPISLINLTRRICGRTDLVLIRRCISFPPVA